MCIACEMAYLMALEDGIPPSTGTASHDPTPAAEASRFACDAPAADPAVQAIPDARKPFVSSRE